MRPPKEPLRYADQRFVGLSQAELPLAGAIVIGCEFASCDLTEVSLKGANLSDCRFVGCELALCDLADAVFQSLEFSTCRLTGAHFETLSQLPIVPSARFDECDLSYTSFQRMDLREFAFTSCRFLEAEFVGCDLRAVDFSGSDLARCVLTRNDLRATDLRTARNYVFSLQANEVRGLRVRLPEAAALLAAAGVELD
ncbi:MAG: pentapeptide repeat-containing protein [Trueperaceae bacterium]|nr:pentapeptide repeat-containing protein [Trueperaceae bacterium]